MGESGVKWEMMLSGEIDVVLDDKNRLTLPMQFRREINEPVVKITRGKHKCLWVLTVEKWNEKVGEAIRKEADYFSDSDNYMIEKYISPTQEVEIDKAGRILLPPRLRKYAGIAKDCVVVGMIDRIAIWDADTYNKFTDEDDEANAVKFNTASEEFSREQKRKRGEQ